MHESQDMLGWPLSQGTCTPLNGPSEEEAGSCLLLLTSSPSSSSLTRTLNKCLFYRLYGKAWPPPRLCRARAQSSQSIHRGVSWPAVLSEGQLAPGPELAAFLQQQEGSTVSLSQGGAGPRTA